MSVLFFRETGGEEFFYPIELPIEIGKSIEEMVKANAELNPGTIRVEDIEGHVLWPAAAKEAR